MAGYSFKSSGNRIRTNEEEKKVVSTSFYSNKSESLLRIGIKTPMQLGTTVNDDIVAMNTTLIEQISDNLKNLLMTNWGERLGRYNYGANLVPLLSEQANMSSIEDEIMSRIKSAISRWMPFVNLRDMSYSLPKNLGMNINIIDIVVSYTVPILSSEKFSTVITLKII